MKASSFLVAAAAGFVVDALPSVNKRQAIGFDPETQYVSVSGEHAWIAPKSSDLRGPCPGLNAMANHGYIPRNGYVSIPQVVKGMGDVYGMGKNPTSSVSEWTS